MMLLDLPPSPPPPAPTLHGLVIDNFAGGGGASTGIEAALGRPIDVAINHDQAAIAVHKANHPHTRHYCQSVWVADPLDVTGGKPVALAWFSPDCKHFSKAKGGKPVEKNIRDLAWVVVHWAQRVRPAVIMLENVEEFRTWGPIAADGRPCPQGKGMEFARWLKELRKAGYKVEHRELRACDYGAPTSRKRLFLIARCDGLPIVWPAPTHGAPNSAGVQAGTLQPWRTAAECIDWSIPCPSIFERKRDLKPATCRRIAAGVMRYVVKSAKPFIVPLTHHGGEGRVYDVDAPIPTVTGAHRGEMAVVSPGIVKITHTSNQPNANDVNEPLRTITTAKGGEMAVTTASLQAIQGGAIVGCGGRRGQSGPSALDAPYPTTTAKADACLAGATLIKLRNGSDGEDPRAPLGTVTASGKHHGVAAATMVQMGYGERDGQAPRALDVEAPLGTVVAGGGKHGLVTAFLEKLSENSRGKSLDDPLDCVMAGAPRHAVVCAHMAQHNGGRVGRAAVEPMQTQTVRGTQTQVVQTTMIEAGAPPPEMMDRAVQVAAFLVKYYGSEIGQHQRVDQPIDTITAKPRFAVITVTIDAVTFVLVDIGMRMLVPRELANAQDFPRGYKLDPVCWYRTDSGALKYGPLPKSHQIAKIGNSVCPVMAETLARANVAVPAMAEVAA